MEKFPREVINKIFFFTSHPVADIYKLELKIAEAALKQHRQNYIDSFMYCDCCACKWSECQCLCSNCQDNYRICRYGCYGN